jgi:hypothetical protein
MGYRESTDICTLTMRHYQKADPVMDRLFGVGI